MVRKKHSTRTTKYRSKFEERYAPLLLNFGCTYEPYKIQYIIPESKHNYTPDFVVERIGCRSIIFELKGRWTREDRKKILYIHSQHPEYLLIMVFQNENLPIYKGSKVTYAKFCQKMNINYINAKQLYNKLVELSSNL